MKNLIAIFLAILMLMSFVSCDNDLGKTNPGNDDNDSSIVPPGNEDVISPEDEDNENNTLVSPTLPEAIGQDPFLGSTEFFDSRTLEKYSVDTEKKTILQYIEDGDTWAATDEWNYSYEVTDDGIILSVYLTKVVGYDQQSFISVQDMVSNPNNYYRPLAEVTIEQLFMVLAEQEDKAAFIEQFNGQYGTSFSVENCTEENFDSLVEEFLDSIFIKDYINQELKTIKVLAGTITKFSITLSENESQQILCEAEGIYDDSKQWYEQTSGSFAGQDSTQGWVAFISAEVPYLYDSEHNQCMVDSINESEIKTHYMDPTNGEQKTKNFTYTKEGSGKDSVVTVTIGQDIELTLRWEPKNSI